MAPFRTVPDELLVEIVSYLLRSDLASVSRLCRRFQRIATPLLYTEAWLGTCNESSIDLGLFIRTIVSPGGASLARLVHHLHLAWSCEVMPLYHEDLPLMLAIAVQCWGFRGRQLTECGQVILLLHLLPELHTLDVFPPSESYEFTDFVDGLSPATLPCALRSLRAYELVFEHFWCSPSARTLLTLLQLPHIASITLPAPDGIYFADADALLAASAASSVTRLKFPFARIPNNELATILAAPRALTHFALFPRSVGVLYDFAALRVAMAPLRASLTCLVLHFWTSRARRGTRAGLGPSRTIGSLRDWLVLRTLRISLLPLLGRGLRGESHAISSVLPEGVSEFEIFEDNVWTADQALGEALSLVRGKRTEVPGLRRLMVFARGGGEEEAREKLRRACVEVGVVCVDYVVRRSERS